MFSKTNSEDKKPIKSNLQPLINAKPCPPSLISSDVSIVGNIKCDGEVQIDGVIEGDIHTGILEVGKSATINGEIVADKVRINGSVNGRIKARSVELFSTARVIGDIMHENLSIETGAFLEGHCKRSIKGDLPPTKPTTSKT
jgi:cytoskeletal protein CcmA (bactofilin family)